MIWVVLPAYNEARRVGQVIEALRAGGFARIVVVDDGSTDATAEVARAAGADVIVHECNRGQGAALQTGNEFALGNGAELIVHFDADDQFDAADIAPAIEKLKQQNLDAVIGSRFLDQRSQIPWLKRRVFFPCARVLNRCLTGTALTDVHNGFRVLNRRAVMAIMITQDGMAHNSEITTQLKRQQLRFAEVPVKVVYHEYGQGLTGGLKIIRDLFLGIFLREK